MLEKIKTYSKWVLGILGVVYLFNLYRKFKDGDVDLDISDITDRIKDGEDKLKEINSSDPDLDTILDYWNKDK